MKNMILILLLFTIMSGCVLDKNHEDAAPSADSGDELAEEGESESTPEPTPEPEIYPYDFGDAPEIYSTSASSDGARHLIDQSLYLGSSVDGEEDGSPSDAADGDGGDDGAAFTDSIIRGNTATLEVTVVSSVAAAYLNVWIDFNADSDWDDAGEQVFTNQLVVDGSQSLMMSIPAASVVGATYMRVRLSTTDVFSTGLGGIGEVEDYRIQIE